MTDGKIGVPDLLELLSQWGECPSGGTCWGDLDGNSIVGVSDLLILLSNWGLCAGNASSATLLSIEEELNQRGVSQARWEDFFDVLEYETRTEQDRWLCWFERYLNGCSQCRPCRGTDPFAQ